MTIASPNIIVGILYGGELGSSLGCLLGNHGVAVVTTEEGRSPRTRRLVKDSGMRVLPGFDDVVGASDVILSLVTPSAAISVAQRFAQAAASQNARVKTFVDVNSISPHTARKIDAIIAEARVAFCDAAVHGMASKLKTQGTLFVSGRGATEVASLFSGVLRTRDLGLEAGRASLMKMLLGGLSKSLVASFLTLAMLSRSSSILDEFLAASRMQYPEITSMIERLLPTYPQHAPRRAEEMAELAETLRLASIPAWFADAARETFAKLAASDLREQWLATGQQHDRPDDTEIVRLLLEVVYRLSPFDQPGTGDLVAVHQDVA